MYGESEKKFASEAELCSTFIAALPADWTAYPETGGFDILLVRSDGFQIGVEAKLKLNAKVILQAAEYIGRWHIDTAGPDCRAVLVPATVNMELAGLCKLVNVTVIIMRNFRTSVPFSPALPAADKRQSWAHDQWYELAPLKREPLPDWVPDVAAGRSAPTQLSQWKISAIKIVIILGKRGYVTRQDFADHKISMSRWTQMRWISRGALKGQWHAHSLPDFRAQHPKNFAQIEADYEKWKEPNRGKLI